MNKASICRMVVAVGFRAQANGTDMAPAVINRVWSEDENGVATVNATLFQDCGSAQCISSAKLYQTEEEARASLQHDTMTALFWPARV